MDGIVGAQLMTTQHEVFAGAVVYRNPKLA
jgi:hypothetical protein